MSILHGTFYKHLHSVRTDGDKKAYEARIPILTFLISTANLRLRTWHGISEMMKYTGFSKAPVSEALSWLETHGAIYNVPKEARTGLEKRVHGNRKVWQLTGIMQIGQEIIDYLFLKEDDKKSVLIEVEDHAPEQVKKLFRELNLLSDNVDISSQDEPKNEDDKNEIGSQNDTKNTEIGSQDELEIGSQNSTTKELSESNLVNDELSKKDIAFAVVSENSKNGKTEVDAPIVQEAKKHLSKSKRERNRLYDMVALVCFDLQPEMINDAGKTKQKLIGKAKKALLEIDDSPDENKLADELWMFKKRYHQKFGKNIAIPRDRDKLVTHFISLRGDVSSSTDFVNTRKPTAQDYAAPEVELDFEGAKEVFGWED